jgi:RNA polymerase sigma-70 factor (ECF subfamily)
MQNDETLSDEEVVENVRSRDQELYAVIIGRYQEKLLRYAGNLVKDEHKAADIVQDAFIKAFVNLKGFDTKKRFSSWIYRIVHNEAMNAVKRYGKELPMDDAFDAPSDESIEDEYMRQETTEQVEACLKKLPLLFSEPLALHYIDGKSYEEMSDILRVPVGTVATRMRKAKSLMKSLCHRK